MFCALREPINSHFVVLGSLFSISGIAECYPSPHSEYRYTLCNTLTEGHVHGHARSHQYENLIVFNSSLICAMFESKSFKLPRKILPLKHFAQE